jgi:hypothetical protein
MTFLYPASEGGVNRGKRGGDFRFWIADSRLRTEGWRLRVVDRGLRIETIAARRA